MQLDDLKAEVEPYKNTLVIDGFDRVVRLVDVIYDYDDYYWVFADRNKEDRLVTVLSQWFPLKGFMKDKDYDRLVSFWNLNHTTKAI